MNIEKMRPRSNNLHSSFRTVFTILFATIIHLENFWYVADLTEKIVYTKSANVYEFKLVCCTSLCGRINRIKCKLQFIPSNFAWHKSNVYQKWAIEAKLPNLFTTEWFAHRSFDRAPWLITTILEKIRINFSRMHVTRWWQTLWKWDHPRQTHWPPMGKHWFRT